MGRENRSVSASTERNFDTVKRKFAFFFFLKFYMNHATCNHVESQEKMKNEKKFKHQTWHGEKDTTFAIDKLTKVIGNSLFLLVSRSSPSLVRNWHREKTHCHQPQSPERHPSLSARSIHVWRKRQDNDWNSQKEHEGHTRTFDGVEKVARGSLSTSR